MSTSPEITAAYAICRDIAKREAKNFYYAFRVLPLHKSNAMCAVYAFMRKADDLADDESLSLAQRREAMAAWTARWRASRESTRTHPTDDPIFLALQHTQQSFDISDDLLEQLVAGTTLDLNPQPEGVLNLTVHDQQGTAHEVQIYENFAALHHYCYLVAAVVGLVCIRIFGYQDRRAEHLAVDTGVAFQLTNILRDVREDAERGRIYISADLLDQLNIEPGHLLSVTQGAAPTSNDIALLRGLEKHAQVLYLSAAELIPLLDPDSRAAMRVLVRIYHGLLDHIARDPAVVFSRRISVPTWQKLGILFGGLVQSFKARLFA